MWHLKHGSWWMVQWAFDGWVSLGIHLDWRRRVTGKGVRYGPYVDFHLVVAIVSFGVNPAYAGDLDAMASFSRGGLGRT